MIGVWHEGALGDLLLSRLAIAHLKRKFGRLILYARNEVRKLYKEAGLADQVLSTEYGIPKDFEILFVFTRSPSLRELFEKAFSGKVRFIETVPNERRHVALFQLEKAGGKEVPAEGLLLRPPGFQRTPQYLLCHPGSGGRTKCYPREDLKQALEILGAEGLPIKVILGPAEMDLEEFFGDFEVFLSSDLEKALKVLSRAKLLVGNDSGLSHLAAALGVPTLALFGPTDPTIWAPFGGQTKILYPFSRLSPQRLATEIRTLLSTTARSHPETEPLEREAEPWVERAVVPSGVGRSDTEAAVEAEEPEPQNKSVAFEELDRLGVEVAVVEAEPR